jgi:hypothetical protein
MSLRKKNDSIPTAAPEISIPYPHTLDPKEFLPKSNSRKPCNGFMIYRKVYQKQLKENSYRFKMTTISRWASDSWLKENKKLKDAYREFASKIARLHSENLQVELETLEDRLNAVTLLAAPYVLGSQPFISPISPLMISSPQHYYHINQSLPSADSYLDNRSQFYENQQSTDSSYFTIPIDNYNNENVSGIIEDYEYGIPFRTLQISPSSLEQTPTTEIDQPFFDNSYSFFY